MSNCRNCNVSLEEKHRWEVYEEWQICVQTNAIPEVDISMAYSIGEYCSKSHAMGAIESYLTERKAKPTWADVSPVETCSCCGKSFSTAERHLTLTLMELSGTDEEPSIHGMWYVARFCRSCVLPDETATKVPDADLPVTIARPKWIGKE
jgi:hypothetical protein